jgi:hypothetical protein
MAEVASHLRKVAVQRPWIISRYGGNGNALNTAEGLNMSGAHKTEPEDPYFHEGMVTVFSRDSCCSIYREYIEGMKMRIAGLLSVGCIAALSLFSAETTWNGKITDSMCEKDHSMMATGNEKPNAKECTLACVKGGSKFVLVSKDKVYQIANQDLADLKTYAGSNVSLTGELQPDEKTIKADKLQAAK